MIVRKMKQGDGVELLDNGELIATVHLSQIWHRGEFAPGVDVEAGPIFEPLRIVCALERGNAVRVAIGTVSGATFLMRPI